jgi:hypothetical protein
MSLRKKMLEIYREYVKDVFKNTREREKGGRKKEWGGGTQ